MPDAKRLFVQQFWKSPRSIGAALPSSIALAEAMLAPIDFAKAKVIVEFGPGTGAVTRALLAKLRPGTKYIGIEINPSFFHALKRDFPGHDFVLGSVEDLAVIAAKHGIDKIDAIVSGLPWASLPKALQETVFREVDRYLAPGGAFVTFAYLQGLILPAARALKSRLINAFDEVGRTQVVWKNVPPAFAYVCRKARDVHK